MNDITKSCRNSTGKLDDQFIGIKFGLHDFEVVFPYGYNIPKEEIECKNSIKSLLLSFSLSKEMYINNKTVSSVNYGDEVIPFSSYFWLISDFLSNGLYLNRFTTNKKNTSGKINWKKTINNKPIFSKNRIFFKDIIVNKLDEDESILTKIHQFCLNVSLGYLGFLYPNIKLPKDRININNTNVEFFIAFIDKEINATFLDRNILLFTHIKKVLLNLKYIDMNADLISFGVKSYELVWERLLKFHFGNRDESRFFPFANWYILNREKYSDSYLRPDSILQVGNKLFILDAKYYQFGIDDDFVNLPHTDSIQKQITYGEYAEKLEPDMDEIYNAFLMPYNKERNTFDKNEDLAIIGFAKSSWKLPLTKFSYPIIFAVLLDTKFIIDSFANKNTKIKNTLSEKIIIANEMVNKKSYIE